MSPVFYMFTDRERAFEIIEAICGFRMHPSWFRIGGVSQDLPQGWDRLVREFLDYMPSRLDEYDTLVMKNRIFKRRTQGVGAYSLGRGHRLGRYRPRACGPAASSGTYRKQRPYSGYEQFEFDIPTGSHGDCYDRTAVRVEEMRQSLRIVRQCLENMPEGSYKSRHPLTTPPLKDHTMHDIETLITHFLNVSWGPVIPPGEASVCIEATKGLNSYYLISDGGTMSVPDTHPHAVVSASSDDPADVPRLDGGRSDRRPGQHRFRDGRCRPLMTTSVLTPAEIEAMTALARQYEARRGACIEALTDRPALAWLDIGRAAARSGAPSGDVRRRAGRRRHVLQPDLPPAGRPSRHPGLRQRLLLDHGLRGAARCLQRPARRAAWAKPPPTAASPFCRSFASAPAIMRPTIMIDDDLHRRCRRRARSDAAAGAYP